MSQQIESALSFDFYLVYGDAVDFQSESIKLRKLEVLHRQTPYSHKLFRNDARHLICARCNVHADLLPTWKSSE